MLKFALIWILIEVGGHLPARVLYALADAAAALAWLVSARQRTVTRAHMRRVLPPSTPADVRDRAARGCIRSAARYWADLGRTSHIEPAVAFDELTSFEGIDHLFAASDRGCGVVLVTAHVGAPEFAMRAASYAGFDLLALTQRLEPPRVNALLTRARRRHGGRFVDAGLAGARSALEHLRGGGVVALVADRDVLGSGVPTPFFGAPAPLPPGPIELALRTRASVIPCFVLRTGVARCVVRFLPPLAIHRTKDREADLRAGLDALARALEAGIRMAPDQWFVLDPIWPAPHAPAATAPKMDA